MRIESKKFIVRDLLKTDKENVIGISESAGIGKRFKNYLETRTEAKGNIDYFELVWELYQKLEYAWIVENKEKGVCGMIQLELSHDIEASICIQATSSEALKGFGKEMLEQILAYFALYYGIKYLYVSLWDENDAGKCVFEEAGYEFEDGELEISL